jgi:hypothetical protein
MWWVLALMVSLQPEAPWRSTYGGTAIAIDAAAHEAPLYPGEDGPERTAALLVAVSWRESRFDPMAVATDCCGTSLGLLQVHDTNARRLGLMGVNELFDPLTNARAALVLLAESLRICAALPEPDRLSEYAVGRAVCDAPAGVRDSRAKVRLAVRLLREHPPFWSEAAASGW